MNRFHVLTLVLLLSIAGCCAPWDEPQPSRPAEVKGWQSYKQGALRVLGEFVLYEGQSVQSDSLGIEILKISPLKTCLARFAEPPRKTVTLRIYRPTDKVTPCEATMGESSGLLPCERGEELASVSINGINTKERWVSLALTETAEK
jgi:hypothetical protein